ncbi:hypothetical protein SELMODRAFT_443259 [Selaginella moellendorffii]|uniref:Macro domain-containing protein n=1 Tax=Selaginella moellendorffii TaxID=88036 RepID=D8RZX8_SELML|nr:uncharacterized protein LOC9649174 [Selaginella moellendorffii]EFJ22375.1 hypothetical protein SELMODRAFT_443259 [Selaginella moellendorffii]|eukprot:XP_002976706.1 uncharacterized protein LOC9649174 [Selaginella moellendorffii]
MQAMQALRRRVGHGGSGSSVYLLSGAARAFQTSASREFPLPSSTPAVPKRVSQPPTDNRTRQPPPPPPPVDSESSNAEAKPPGRASSVAPVAPIEKQSTCAKPPTMSPGFTGALGLNFPGTQIPGLPGTPRPKPGTPRPYDPTKQKSKVMEWLTPPPAPTELLQRVHYKMSETCFTTIYFGDLSKWHVDGKYDAVIAPGNKRLNTGPAVNAVLFKAAGSRLLDATQRLPDVAPQGIKAEVGDAISTRAFNLPVARVIHTVGPVYKKDETTNVRESDPYLEKAYKAALLVARRENLKYLAFPPLSCRIYGYPYSEGAEVALRTLKANCEGFLQIDIVIRNIEGYEAFIDEANKVLHIIKEKKIIMAPSATTPAPAPSPEPAPAVNRAIAPGGVTPAVKSFIPTSGPSAVSSAEAPEPETSEPLPA